MRIPQLNQHSWFFVSVETFYNIFLFPSCSDNIAQYNWHNKMKYKNTSWSVSSSPNISIIWLTLINWLKNIPLSPLISSWSHLEPLISSQWLFSNLSNPPQQAGSHTRASQGTWLHFAYEDGTDEWSPPCFWFSAYLGQNPCPRIKQDHSQRWHRTPHVSRALT